MTILHETEMHVQNNRAHLLFLPLMQICSYIGKWCRCVETERYVYIFTIWASTQVQVDLHQSSTFDNNFLFQKGKKNSRLAIFIAVMVVVVGWHSVRYVGSCCYIPEPSDLKENIIFTYNLRFFYIFVLHQHHHYRTTIVVVHFFECQSFFVQKYFLLF